MWLVGGFIKLVPSLHGCALVLSVLVWTQVFQTNREREKREKEKEKGQGKIKKKAREQKEDISET